ncbi:MAG TPA: trifunctional glycosyltransferase/class I SAM-dependent methyltransferase/polysaccharide deacetylase [Baekduia sp.]
MAAISVVIPAYNREATLGVSLDSLIAQTHPDWEAIVVDDGSKDGTAAVADEYAARDPRIRVHRQPNGGVSAARNTAIDLARHPFLFFLDADDWVTPEAFAQLTAALDRHPDAQLINGGCTRILADGTELPEERVAHDDDLFAKFARTCAFSIHTSLVDTELVRRLGGFDTSLITCEDWDLWQRIVRTHARFASIPENIAYYRVRGGSASADGVRMLTDGLLVIARGHGEDPRLAGWPGARQLGEPATSAPTARMYLAAYAAGLEVAKGVDAGHLFDLIEDRHAGDAEGVGMAHTIFNAVSVARGTSVRRWPDYPPEVHQHLHAFVDAVGRFSRDHWLALTMSQTLEELILQNGVDHEDLQVGRTRVTRPPLCGPIADVRLDGAERLMVVPRGLDAQGPPLVLPAAGPVAPAAVVADALAAAEAWEILRRHLAATVYPELSVERDARIRVRRGRVELADVPAAPEVDTPHALHAAVGWSVLLQEVWGRPEWSHDQFYDLGDKPARDDREGPVVARADLGVVEIAEPLPAVTGVDGPLDVDVALAGIPLLRVRVRVAPARDGQVSAQALRGAISYAAGFELCHVVVREALLLYAGAPGASLRERLAAIAQRRTAAPAASDGRLVPGWAPVAREVAGAATLLGRYRYGSLSGAAGRLTLIPGAAREHVRALARHTGQPLIEHDGAGADTPILHAPFVIDRDREAVELGLRSDGRARWFERRHVTGARRPPTVAAVRREHVLDLVPEHAGQVLEVGSSDPWLTAQLGRRADRLVVADISWLALQEAAARCADAANVSFQRTDVFEEPLPAGNDLVVCGDVLRWAEGERQLRAGARRLIEALAPGGTLVITSSMARAGGVWRALHVGRHVELVAESRAPTFVVQRYARRASRLPRAPWRSGPAVRQRAIDLADDDGAATAADTPPLDATPHEAVPVLMYHRIATDGAPEAARWRTDPAAFEEQLAYLKENGYRSIDIDEWAGAVALDRPLPGRGVILTFDDGFADFGEEAVPLLERYGFRAELFVVTGHVGGTDAWDTTWERREPLMDWQALSDLPADRVRIGSHTVGHAALTAVTPADAVRELVESRITLEDRLGRRVSTIAYPFGLNDGAIQRLAGAVGYEVGYTTMPWWAFPTRNLLDLPRLEVRGGDPLETFARLVDRPAA